MGEYLVKILDRIGVIALFSTIIYTILQFVIDSLPSYVLKMVAIVVNWIDNDAFFTPNFVLSEYNNTLAMVNYFFPLDECWEMMVDSIPYIFGVLTIRWIKSFIPGIN